MSQAKQLHNRRYLHDYLEIINREGLPGNMKTDLGLQVQDVVSTTCGRVSHPPTKHLSYIHSACSPVIMPQQTAWSRPFRYRFATSLTITISLSVCSVFRDVLHWTMEHLVFCSADDQVWIFGKAALSLFTYAETGQTT